MLLLESAWQMLNYRGDGDWYLCLFFFLKWKRGSQNVLGRACSCFCGLIDNYW